MAEKTQTTRENCVKLARMYVVELEQEKKRDLDIKYKEEKDRLDFYLSEQKTKRDRSIKEVEDRRS